MNDTHPRRRNPRPGRARKRAIREQAARTGVPYSVAARVIADLGLQPGESVASHGRTIYPSDPFRQFVAEQRERRSFAERLADTRQAALLPDGRPHHLAGRFPPGRGRPGTGVGRLYAGEGRPELLTMLYLAVAVECPSLVPDPGGLAWVAEMGEETAIDMECAELDRAARAMLESDTTELWPRLAGALTAAANGEDAHLKLVADRLAPFRSQWSLPSPGISAPGPGIPAPSPGIPAPSPGAPALSSGIGAPSSPGAPAPRPVTGLSPDRHGDGSPGDDGRDEHTSGRDDDRALTHDGHDISPRDDNRVSTRDGHDDRPQPALVPPLDGVSQILDALLMVAEDGHAPGTRVRALAGHHRGRTATIVGAVWGAAGPPIAYRIQLDGATTTLGMAAGELAILAGQESLPG
jgi:hypothetical protein